MALDLVDIGANLTHASFDHDRDEVLARALAAGVAQLVVTGSNVDESRAAARLALANPAVLYATAGIHPHHARELDGHTIPALRDIARERGVVAIGECGLDWYRNYSPHEAQERAFIAQLELASELRLPVFLHQRDAHARFIAIVREHRSRLVHAVAHCFTGTAEELADCLELDLHVGITGWICDERRGSHLRELVKDIPGDRLMLETDAPYLLPRDLSPRPATRRNEPAFLPHIARVVATGRGESAEELARTTSETARRFFGLAAPGSPAGRLIDRASRAGAEPQDDDAPCT
jgi:TatD DNase family protein